VFVDVLHFSSFLPKTAKSWLNTMAWPDFEIDSAIIKYLLRRTAVTCISIKTADVLAAWKLASTHCNALQTVWQSGPFVSATRSASWCSRDPRDSAASIPLFASRAVCTDWTVCSRTNTHDIALGGRGKHLSHALQHMLACRAAS
jgi:hypothetical protein